MHDVGRKPLEMAHSEADLDTKLNPPRGQSPEPV
jgi:hypothetical protein